MSKAMLCGAILGSAFSHWVLRSSADAFCFVVTGIVLLSLACDAVRRFKKATA